MSADRNPATPLLVHSIISYLYQQAVRWQKDNRLTVGRSQKVEILQAHLRQLCA